MVVQRLLLMSMLKHGRNMLSAHFCLCMHAAVSGLPQHPGEPRPRSARHREHRSVDVAGRHCLQRRTSLHLLAVCGSQSLTAGCHVMCGQSLFDLCGVSFTVTR